MEAMGAAEATVAEGLVGRVIGGYRLVRVLSEEGASATLLGQHVDAPEQQAAIKIALAPWGTPAERGGLRAQFNREAQTLFALQHPHLLGIYALGVDVVTGSPYMVLPHPQGGTLAQRIAPAALPLPMVADYLAQLADALDTAHGLGMVHGDLTPAGILLDEAEQLYLGDFGKAPSHAAYTAPELARGQDPTPSADRYSLGVVLYEMVTGYVPFQGATQAIVLMQHAQLPPPPPRALRPELPEPAEAVLLRALSKQPSARFASATALAEAFARGLRGESLPDEETTLSAAEPAVAPISVDLTQAAEDAQPQAVITATEHDEQEAEPAAPTRAAPVTLAVPIVEAPVTEPSTAASMAPSVDTSPPSEAPQATVAPEVAPEVAPQAPPAPPSPIERSRPPESVAPARAVAPFPTIVPVTTNPPRSPQEKAEMVSHVVAATAPTTEPVVPARTTPSIASAATPSIASAATPEPTTMQPSLPATFPATFVPVAGPVTKYLVPPALIRNVMLAIFALVLGIAAIAELQFLGAVELALTVVVVALFMYCGIILPGLTTRQAQQP